MTRVAAVDCGTNSIRLLVADVDPDTGELVDLERRMRIVRLGQGVDRTGRLAPEALERTFAACQEYAEVVAELGARHVRFIATSASRDARNRDEFTRGVVAALGVEPRVISGAEEAEYSFVGATRELAGRAAEGRATEPTFAPPYLVVDIGGGSTEFVAGDQRPDAARSVDVGCVRLTERHLTRSGQVVDRPTAERVAAMRQDIRAALDTVQETVPVRDACRPEGGGHTLVGLAGSVTTVGGIALGLTEYDSAAIHHTRVSLGQVRQISDRLLNSGHQERAAIPVMHPGRVDVIGAGALVLRELMERTGAEEVVVSEHDILDGIAHTVAREAR